MTAPGGPRLVRPGEAVSAPPASPSATEHRGGRWRLPLALAAALAGVVAWSVEARRVHVLDARVAGLTASLRAAEEEVAAYRSHLDAIRGGVAGVRERLDALQALAAQNPAAPRETGGAPSDDAHR
jgi:hypothetical protein